MISKVGATFTLLITAQEAAKHAPETKLRTNDNCQLMTDPQPPSCVYMEAVGLKNRPAPFCTFLYNSHANNVSAFPTNARMLMPQCDFSHYSQFNARIALNGCFNLRSKTFVCKYCKSTDIVLQSHISHDCPAKNNQMH